MVERASISSIAYHLGTTKPIDEIDFLRADPDKLALYKLAGFQYYAETDQSMSTLAQRSAHETLKRCGVDRKEIGVCIYVAESFDRDEVVNSAEVNRLLVALGLANTVPIHVSSLNCANIIAALRVALALIEAGETEHVLVISVDKAPRRYGGRKMFQEMSIKSDVSVSCLVSRPGAGTLGIIYLGQQSMPALVDVQLDTAAAYAMQKFSAIRRTANLAKNALSLGSADFARILTNNYGREVMKMFIELCGFSKTAGWYANLGRFAHAVAGDVLINLKDLEAEGGIKRGDRLFLMSDSITSSSALCLEAR